MNLQWFRKQGLWEGMALIRPLPPRFQKRLYYEIAFRFL